MYFEVPLSKGYKEKKEKHIRTITTCKVHGVKDKSFMQLIAKNEERYKAYLEKNLKSEALYFYGKFK